MSHGAQTYLVGGSVRDALLGLPVQDRDWVVVGATVDQMIAAGYTPVGKDFPVFLHPRSKEEYALARTERKSGRGYHGFTVHAAPDVTLEEDLARRDLTINAMAQAADGTIIDPYGGRADLEAKVLRHVSPSFAEDPLRVLRLARFAARFGDFSIAPQTIALARTLVGELPTLPAERVWHELARGLMEQTPYNMFDALMACGAWAVVFPEIPAPQKRHFSEKDLQKFDLAQRYALLAHEATSTAIHRRLKVPADCTELATLVSALRTPLARFVQDDAKVKLKTCMQGDAIRRPERLRNAARVVETIEGVPNVIMPALDVVLRALAGIDAGAIARGRKPSDIPAALEIARLAALEALR